MKIRQAIKILNNDYGFLFRYKQRTISKARKAYDKKYCKNKRIGLLWSLNQKA